MKSHLWQPAISKFSGGAYLRSLLGCLAPSNESGLALIYAACYALLDACENVSVLRIGTLSIDIEMTR